MTNVGLYFTYEVLTSCIPALQQLSTSTLHTHCVFYTGFCMEMALSALAGLTPLDLTT